MTIETMMLTSVEMDSPFEEAVAVVVVFVEAGFSSVGANTDCPYSNPTIMPKLIIINKKVTK